MALVFGGLLAAGGLYLGVRIYRELKYVGQLPRFLRPAPPKYNPWFTPVPYPLELPVPDFQNEEAWARWYHPDQLAARCKQAEQVPQDLARKAWNEAGGVPSRAVEILMPLTHSADGAQAMLQMLRDLTVQGSERFATEQRNAEAELQKAKDEAEAALSAVQDAETRRDVKARRDEALARFLGSRPAPPQFPAPAGKPGIESVVTAARVLAQRRKTAQQGPFDAILLLEALRLMAYHGASEVPPEGRLPTLDGRGKAAPINMAVREFLRTLLSDRDLQPVTGRALAILGDVESALEVAEHPARYPRVKFSDFGPVALELYRNRRSRGTRMGAGEEHAFERKRLQYWEPSARFDLLKPSDFWNGLGYERNMEVDNLFSGEKPDDRFARFLDTYLRFPNTRQAEQAEWALTADSGLLAVFESYGWEQNNPKTMDLLLRYFDMAMRRTFVTRRPMEMEPVLELSILTAAWHYRKYKPHRWKSHERFFTALDDLFRKYFPSGKNLQQINTMKKGFLSLTRTNTYALHVGLKMIKLEAQMVWIKFVQLSWNLIVGKLEKKLKHRMTSCKGVLG